MTMKELYEYKIIEKVLDCDLKTEEGLELKIGSYKTSHKGKEVEHAVVYKGNIINPKEPILLRINSACYTSDIFSCTNCDCNWQLREAMKLISVYNGLIIYHFHHEARGAGFTIKIKEKILTDTYQLSTYDAFLKLNEMPEQRRFISSVVILKDLGINSVRLITNNPEKKNSLLEAGIEVVETIPLIGKQERWRDYLESKREQFGHLINI